MIHDDYDDDEGRESGLPFAWSTMEKSHWHLETTAAGPLPYHRKRLSSTVAKCQFKCQSKLGIPWQDCVCFCFRTTFSIREQAALHCFETNKILFCSWVLIHNSSNMPSIAMLHYFFRVQKKRITMEWITSSFCWKQVLNRRRQLFFNWLLWLHTL